jgi:hypothetical protein
MATSNAPLSATNLLNELDGAAQEVIGKVTAAQVPAAPRSLSGGQTASVSLNSEFQVPLSVSAGLTGI